MKVDVTVRNKLMRDGVGVDWGIRLWLDF